MKIKRIKPGPGQESVWDYPRPPKLEAFSGHLRVVFNKEVILDCNQAMRILETSHPPTFYIPISDFKQNVLRKVERISYCEFKGEANYFDIAVGDKVANQAAWCYERPNKKYGKLKNTVSIYAHRMDACFVNDELVKAQKGDFYGGWITNNVVGPFKGTPDTLGW